MAQQMGVRAIGLQNLAPSQLKPNPHNPRMLFDRLDMEILQESIKRVGILVPLTVYKETGSGAYRILDGQRRWMCAQELKLKTIPVNEVEEPSLVQNIVTMFQIHKLRKDWELMPTALKVELLMRELQEKRDKHLAKLTGLDEAVVVRCKKLLSYPKRFQDLMLDVDPEKRIKADFFIELHAVLHDRNVATFKWFKRDRFTEQMLTKFKSGSLKSVTDFRLVKQHITNAAKADKFKIISDLLKEFADDVRLGPDHLLIQEASSVATVRTITRAVDQLHRDIGDLNVDEAYGADDLWDKLEKLVKLIRTKLRKAGRRPD